MVKPNYKGRSTINPSKASTNPGTGGGARGGWSFEKAWGEGSGETQGEEGHPGGIAWSDLKQSGYWG